MIGAILSSAPLNSGSRTANAIIPFQPGPLRAHLVEQTE
jgi:hypothetical protein